MKKRISCLILAIAMVVTACFAGISYRALASAAEDTEVTKIEIMNQSLTFYLSANDYADAPANNASASGYTEYNFWDQIVIYTDATTSKTLKEAYENRADAGKTTFYNLWTRGNTFAVALDQDSLDNAVKVVIKKATEFPSYAYTSGALSDKKSYVTKEETVYVKSTDTWEKGSNEGGEIKDLTSTPANGDTLELLSGGICQFVKNYKKGSSTEYCTKEDCFAPEPVHFSWSPVQGATEYVLELSLSDSMQEPVTYKAVTNSLDINDLMAGKTYFYRIKVPDGKSYKVSKIFTFKTAALPRTILIDSISNTRDLGGYLTTDGKYRVRQGMVYRGANLDSISAAGKKQFLETYKIKTDLDVRGDKKRSPLGNDVNFVGTTGPQYIQMKEKQYKEALATQIRTFADPSNYPVYFHCQIGRDRTGTQALLLYALLGVSEADIYKDYELSMFSAAGWADNTPVNTLLNEHFSVVVDYLKNYKADGNLQSNTEAFLKDEIGITQEEIDMIKSLMLEEAGTVSEYDTEIAKIQIRAGKLIVFLDTMDYETTGHSIQLSGSLADYNILDSVTLSTDGETKTLRDVYDGHAWYNVFETENSIAFDLKSGWDGTTVKKVEFAMKSAFPSYHFTNGKDTIKTKYVLTQATTYTTATSNTDNVDWTVADNSTPKRTDVSSLRSGHNGNILTILLTDSDYTASANTKVGEKHTVYNYLDQICLYFDDNTSMTLKEAYLNGGQIYYNMWDVKDTYSIELKEGVLNRTVRIEIPSGCVFPSYAYTNGSQAKKYGYAVQDKRIFEKAEGKEYWTVKDTSEPEDTIVTKLLSGHNDTILTFYLSEADYEGTNKKVGAAHEDYNYMSKIRLYTDDDTYVTLQDAYSDGQLYYNMWGQQNTLSVEVDSTVYEALKKVVVPKDTVFPAYAHTDGGEAFAYGYRTTKDNVFGKPKGAVEGKPGYQWNDMNPAVNHDTVVTAVHVRHESGKILLFLNNHDYAGIGGTVKIGNLLTAGNVLEKITIYRKDGVSKTLEELYTGEGYYNLWGEEGCIGLDMMDGWDGTNVEKIVVDAGCEFPSYTYTSGATYDKTFYKTKYVTTFTATVYPESGYDNVFYEQSMEIPPQAVDTKVTGATILGAKGDMRLIISLNRQDYKDVSDSTALTRRFADYNTLSNIVLVKEKKKVSLADAVNTDEIYYNLWGRTDTVSYGLKAKYTTGSFDQIIVQNGCEFPAASYTQSDSVEKIAYTTVAKQTVKLKKETHKVSYYDTNNRLLYTDQVASGTALTLRTPPKRAGYKAVWSGMKYTLMPAEDISYVLTYEKNTAVKEKDSQSKADDAGMQDEDTGAETEDQNSDKTSPKTGYFEKAVKTSLPFILFAGLILICIGGFRKKMFWQNN